MNTLEELEFEEEPVEDGNAAKGLTIAFLVCLPFWVAVIFVVLKSLLK